MPLKLKSKTILDRKPDLKLCPNHFKQHPTYGRVYDSKRLGPAVKDNVYSGKKEIIAPDFMRVLETTNK